MDNPEKPRDAETMKRVKKDIAELRKSSENDLLEQVLYEANAPNKDNTEALVHTNECLVHTLKWLAAHQIILNEKLRRLTVWAWVFGISAVVSAIFQIISVILAALLRSG